MLKNILVPLDGSRLAEAVLPYTTALARGLSARLHLLHVIDPEAIFEVADEHRAFLDQVQQNAEAAARVYLERTAKPLIDQGLAVSTSVVYGRPAELLAAYSEGREQPVDLIALSTHGRSGIARVFLGSVADRVLHSSLCPLLLIHPSDLAETGVSLSSIVVPLDGSELAEAVLPLATELAQALDLALNLIWVVPVATLFYAGGDAVPYPSSFVQEVLHSADAYLSKTAEQLKSAGVRCVYQVLLHNAPGAAIIDAAKSQGRAIIAMSTHGRSGFGRWLLGSVTNQVVRSSGLPVLVVRPPGAPSLGGGGQ